MQEPIITVVGNVGAPPRMRVLDSGAIVTDFRIASTPRRKDRATDSWVSGETIWFGVSCWRVTAEHVAASVQKGDRVVVSGRLRATTWQTEQGDKRSGLEIDATTVGFDLSRGRVLQDRPAPLDVTSPPGLPDRDPAPDGVDLVTGEMLHGPDEDDELDDVLDEDDLVEQDAAAAPVAV
jgi:single-strand DNA-binding protein